jgi:protoporphyrinogen oxidase
LQNIYIIGGGIAGLIAAKTLESHGYSPIIIEATDKVGGRIKTDIINNHQLDHGFQVLLNSYPQAQKHLNYKALDLQEFRPGAVIYKDGKSQTIGDPLRDSGFIWSTLTASIGNFSDKIKILKLNSYLKTKSIEAIFESENTSTLQYLKSKGFSDSMISDFFRPFFTGIFLEPNLMTSSRMFEFVYKMFGDGLAVLPKDGIGAIPQQLQSQLKQTEFIYSTKVKSINTNSIVLENGEILKADYIIIATEPNHLIPNVDYKKVSWKSCYNLYFEINKRTIEKPIIGLIADESSLINNIFYCNSISTGSVGKTELLSVTVVKPTSLNETDLIDKVKTELEAYCNISVGDFVRLYHIKSALPELKELKNNVPLKEIEILPSVFLAGDYLLNGSLNAAMISGETAAEAVVKSIKVL